MLGHLTAVEKLQGGYSWHAARQRRITASDAPIIMGVSKWTTPYQLWMQKVSPLMINDPTPAQKRGLELEEKARDFFRKKTQLDVFPRVLLHKDHPWIMASFDGMTDNSLNVVEIKCPGRVDHECALYGNVPAHYYPQLQHLLLVSGIDMIHYLSFDGEDGVILQVKRNEEYIEKMFEKERQFYECMQTLTPPELTEKDVIHRFDQEFELLALEYKSVKTSLRYLEKREEELRTKLVELSEFRSSEGFGIKLFKYAKKGLIQYDAIPELKNLNLDSYRKETSFHWKITIAKEE